MLKKYPTLNSIKERGVNLTNSYKAFFLTVFFLLSIVTTVAQNSINKSPALKSLLQQIDKNYVPQKLNMNIDEIAISIPFLYVQLVGSAMRNQKGYLKQNPASLKKFENLNKEILSIIPQIADAYNKTNYNKIDYEYNDALELKDYYYRALDGIYSQNFKQNYREFSGKNILQVNIPFILDPDEPNYIKTAREDNAIVLLGEKVLPESSPHELQGPFVIGLKCPLNGNGHNYIDTNKNPEDKTYMICDYVDGFLRRQEPLVNGYKHGEYRSYTTRGIQQNYPHHLTNRGYYNNGKKHDFWEEYSYSDEAGKSLLRKRIKFDNDSILLIEKYRKRKSDSYRSVYLGSRSIFIKGEKDYKGKIKWKTTWFYENGQAESHTTYYFDGTYVTNGCWEKNGTPKTCLGSGYW